MPLPAGVDVVRAAPLAAAGLTAYHAVQRSRERLASARSTIAVIGAGGLGHMAIQNARLLTPAQVIAIDVSDDKFELAIKSGVHHAFLNRPGVVDDIRGTLGGHGA
jgi:alcohol dehydrogenase, propanol-preferring